MANQFDYMNRAMSWAKTKVSEFHTFIQRQTDADTWPLIGVWFLFLDALNIVLKTVLIAQTPTLEAQLLPAFAGRAATAPNVNLVTYLLVIVGLFGAIGIVWLKRVIPHLSLRRIISDESVIPPKMAALATLVCGVFLKGSLLPALFLAASFCFAMHVFITHYASRPRPQKVQKWSGMYGALACALLALTLCATGAAGLRLYIPLSFTNDYYELNSAVKTSALFQSLPANAPETMTEAQARDCLSRDANGISAYSKIKKIPSPVQKNGAPRKTAVTESDGGKINGLPPVISEMRTSRLTKACPLPKEARPKENAFDVMKALDGWQQEGGRLLFHHAYIFVPAHYMATHGMQLAIPALYGYGHTAVYAALMKIFGDDLSTYFKIFYGLSFAGILIIAAIIGWVARSRRVFLFAAALSLIAYYCVGYSAIYLAASFTPMRGIGFAVQMASIFFFVRSQTRAGYLALLGGLVFAMTWNFEFAMIGALGQAFILLSPALRCTLADRIRKILGFGLVLAALFVAKHYLEQGMLITNNVGFFNVGTRSVDKHGLVQLLIKVTLVLLASAYVLKRFYTGGERHARFALLGASLLMLVKYVFNGSPGHLFTTLVVVLPMAALLLPPFQKTLWSWRGQIIGSLALSCVLVAATFSFYAGHTIFTSRVIAPVVMQPWTKLHETVANAVPEEAIYSRIKTIREAMEGKERMLLLSPYDHVLSYYANPKAYCGSFDTLLNLVVEKDRDSVVQCALDHDGTVVIYDKDLEVGCPDFALYGEDAFRTRCENRLLLKADVGSIREKLAPHLRLIKETDDLQVYTVIPDRKAAQTKM